MTSARLPILAGLFLCLFHCNPATGETIPPVLPPVDDPALKAAQHAARHALRPDGNGAWVARNPGQRWATTFDGRAFLTSPDHQLWTWGLALESWGRPGHEHPVTGRPAATATGGRIEYNWGGPIREWFVNDARGLEQGWTVLDRPAHPDADGPAAESGLVVTLTVRGGLVPQVEPEGTTITFADQQGSAMLTYGGLKAWDADGRTLAARFVESTDAGATRVRVWVNDRNARYPVTIDPVAQQAYLKASNTEAGDAFGRAVAVSGDTVVIGAPTEDSIAVGINGNQAGNTANGAGAAYVFVRNGSTWTQQAYLKASNTGAGDAFGNSVAISGDTIAVGAYLESSNATSINGAQTNDNANASGAVYVFTRSGTTWTQQAYLKSANSSPGDWLGHSVALSGNVLIAGAPYEDSASSGVNGNGASESLTSSGAAYVFVRTGTTWTQQAYLKAGSPSGSDFFGWSVAASGEGVIVGAPWEDSNASAVNGDETNNTLTQSGAAYVFARTGTTWNQQAYLKPGNPGFTDFFGWSVALAGDVAVAGAIEEDSAATGINGAAGNNDASNAGAAYVFARSGTSWTQQAYLKASNTGTNDSFGQSVAVSGQTVVVGAQKEDSSATGIGGDGAGNAAGDAGAVYVFLRRDGAWTQQAYLKASNTDAGDGLGVAVAVAGSTVVAGADREDSAATTVGGSQTGNSASDAGAAYVFAGMGSPLLEVARSGATVTLRWPAESAGWGLEATDTLQGGSWTPVAGTPTIDAAQRVLSLPVDRARRFFRLR